MEHPVITAVNTPSLRSSFTANRTLPDMKFKAELQFLGQMLGKNEKLANCTEQSLKNAMLDVAFSGLSLRPSLGYAYLVPYKNGSTFEAQFQAGYRGLLHMVYKAGTVALVQTGYVVPKDPTFRVWTDIEGKHILHEEARNPDDRDVTKLTHAYCVAKFTNGSTYTEIMTAKQVNACEQAAKRKGGGYVWNGPWRSEMVAKSVIRRAWKKFPMDPEGLMAHAMEVANRFDPVSFDDEPADSPPPEYVVISEEQELALHASLTEGGLSGSEATEWLQKYAEARGYASIKQLPADAVEGAQGSLMTRLGEVKERKNAAAS